MLTAEVYATREENVGRDFGLFNALDQIVGHMDFACDVENFAQKLSQNGNNVYRYDTRILSKLIFDVKYGELIGAHIIGEGATEMIAELNIAKALESTWEDLAMTMHAHPTLSEAIHEATADAFNEAIHI